MGLGFEIEFINVLKMYTAKKEASQNGRTEIKKSLNSQFKNVFSDTRKLNYKKFMIYK